jgi:hypothetical protein
MNPFFRLYLVLHCVQNSSRVPLAVPNPAKEGRIQLYPAEAPIV